MATDAEMDVGENEGGKIKRENLKKLKELKELKPYVLWLKP